MNSSLFGLDGLTPQEPLRDLAASAREEALLRENAAAVAAITELKATLRDREQALTQSSSEKEKILNEWKKMISQAASMQRLLVAKEAEIAKLETISTETKKLLQQSEENQKNRLLPELRSLQANLASTTHECESVRIALDAKCVAFEKQGAESEVKLAKARHAALQAEEESDALLAGVRKECEQLTRENSVLSAERSDLILEVTALKAELPENNNNSSSSSSSSSHSSKLPVGSKTNSASPSPSPSSNSNSSSSSSSSSSKDQQSVADVKNCSLPGCNEAGVYRCMKCKKVSYCGQDHQKSHWKVHKKSCSE
jgi:hypothetical protein